MAYLRRSFYMEYTLSDGNMMVILHGIHTEDGNMMEI